MKIRALRVREVGCLFDPIALEGLGGGLDVLAGPNELGKSTLFRALEAVFFVPHTSKAGAIREWMVPNRGGAPVIEVDFEIGGTGYRLRKQFFTSPKAVLEDAGKAVSLRGADVEAQLAEMLAKLGGADRLRLLWVGQQGALKDFSVDAATSADLKGLIELEVSAAAGGQHAHTVRTMVRERLSALVTGARRQPRGILKEALERRQALTAVHDTLRQKAVEGQAALERLAALRASHAQLNDVATKSRRSQRIAAARAALEAARAASLSRQTAEEASKRLRQEHAAASATLAGFDARARDLAVMRERLADLNASRLVAQTDKSTALKQQEAANTLLSRLAADESAMRERFEDARRLEVASAHRAGLAKRLAQATALSGQIAELRADLAANPASHELLREAEDASRLSILGAATTRVAISYAAGASGQILKDGEPIPADEQFEISRPVELVIAGIGRVRITPPASAEHSKAATEAARKRLAEILKSMAVACLDDLRAMVRRRATQDVELGRMLARLSGLCPEGPARLQMEIDGHSASEPTQTSASLGEEFGRLQAQRKNADATLKAKEHQARHAELAAARLETETAALAKQHHDLLLIHPPTEQRSILAVALQTATEQSQQALVELSAHRAREPDAARMAAIEHDLDAAILADSQALNQANSQANEMARLETALKRDEMDGIGERLAECEGELEAAGKRLVEINRDVEALTLLKDMFEQVSAETSARYLRPVTERLQPYLQTLLPGAELELSDGFGAEAMRRGGQLEKLTRLSDGTREQVAVLVRLGLARFLADTGETLPLILDDALVFSDDDRIVSAFTVMRAAARHHQVIVLTCRAKAFEALDGTRLALRPWTGFAE